MGKNKSKRSNKKNKSEKDLQYEKQKKREAYKWGKVQLYTLAGLFAATTAYIIFLLS